VFVFLCVCVGVCGCVRACVRACVCAGARAPARVCDMVVWEGYIHSYVIVYVLNVSHIIDILYTQ